MRRISFLSIIGAALAVVGLTGVFLFNVRSAINPSADNHQDSRDTPPVFVSPIPGTTLSRVVLTPRAAERLGIETAPARLERVGKLGNAARTVIPYAAVIYDVDGATWTYTNPEAYAYIRQAITVDHIDGEVAVLESGPPPGTAVVTVGAAELYGSETEFEEE